MPYALLVQFSLIHWHISSRARHEWGGIPNGISANAVSGYFLTNYQVNNFFGVSAPATATIAPFTATPLCTMSGSFCDFLPFYFVAPGTYDFTFSYKLNNGTSTKTGTVEYIVSAPLASPQGTFLEEIEVGRPQILAPGQDASGASDSILSSGDSIGDERGIRFRATASRPVNQSGYFQWVQKVITRNRVFRTYESIGCSFCAESQALDNVYPYPPDLGREEDTQDTPNTFLSFTKTENGQQVDLQPYDISDGFKAEMYLMWDPALNIDGTPAPGCAAKAELLAGAGLSSRSSTCTGSIPVPLGSIVWGYCGEAIQTLKNQPTISPTPASAATSWILACPAGGTSNQVIEYKDGLSAWSFPYWTVLSQNY